MWAFLLQAFLSFMADSMTLVFLVPCTRGSMQVSSLLSISIMHSEFMCGLESLTCLRKSIPSTESHPWWLGADLPCPHPCVAPPHEPDLVRAFPLSGQAWGRLFPYWASIRLLLYWEKVVGRTPVYDGPSRVFFPLIPTSTWMSPFLTDLDLDFAMALISFLYPNLTLHLAPPHWVTSSLNPM